MEKLHKSMNNLQQALARLEKDDIPIEDKGLISTFANTWLAKGYTKLRVVKILYCLRYLSKWLKKPFQTADKQDIITLVGFIEQQPYADYTKYDFKVVLKMFYRWLKGQESDPIETAWLKPKVKHRYKLPEDLLIEEDVLKIAKAATNQRDKAFVLMLYETGCRIGELLTLTLKNVAFGQYGAVLKVSGKTSVISINTIALEKPEY